MTRLPLQLSDYPTLVNGLGNCSDEKWIARCRLLCLTDLYFLIRYALNRPDIEHEWLFNRCVEVNEQPNGYLDLWAREHYKSTVITYGKTIQDVLANPEITVGIFSHTRPIAKSFLRQIKREFEANETLKRWFPDVLWSNPSKEAPKWSEDDGIIVKRKTNPKEATVEAWGLVDGQPTGRHFGLMVYDDVVTRESVTTPEMIAKTTEALELSYNLGSEGGRRRMIGTRYHFNDTYKTVMQRGSFVKREYAATDDGTVTGNPVLLSPERLAEKRRDMGPYTFACQLLQNPIADATQGFKREWVRIYKNRDGAGMNKYILVDPAGAKKKGSDYTAIGVIGLAADRNYYLLDAVYDRLNLTERTNHLIRLHKKWRPLAVGYEKYGKDSDIEHIQHVQELSNYRFDITPLGGQLKKEDRIKRMIPMFEQNRFFLPENLFHRDYEGKLIDIVEKFLSEEYDPFPVGLHDDFFDMLSRICDEDVNVIWPMIEEESDGRYKEKRRYGSAWAA